MVKEIKAYDNWVDSSEFNALSVELYRAATEDTRHKRLGLPRIPVNPRVPTLQDIISCDRERLGHYEDVHGLWYHWISTLEKGAASYTSHGQEIEISWWHAPSLEAIRFEVRVKNPTLETFLAIDPQMRRKMRFQSVSGDYVDVRRASI